MINHDAAVRQEVLISAFADALDRQPAPIFEAHISCIVAAGVFAYKFKKPVQFDFVYFSTLARCHFYSKRNYG